MRKLRNLPGILALHAQTKPAAVAYRFFQGSSLDHETLTFHDLWEQSASVAYLLQEQGLAGLPVLLVCKSQKNFVTAFFGCLLAGAIAVPTAPPRRQALLGRLQILTQDARISAVISDTDEMKSCGLEQNGHSVPHFDMRNCPQGNDQTAAAKRWTLPSLSDDSIAFLQYTSGSTGDPKGVMVTHGNLMRNCAVIQEAMAFTPSSSILTALPLFHDMGLVGGVLESMFVGCIGNCMPPAEFVQYPERWIQIISAFGITISGGPNFMYDLAARSITAEQLERCDLSAWQVAFCGAEPIRAATIARFTQKFSSVGFAPKSFYPCYGMAESTLFITGKELDALPEVCTQLGTEVVSCGVPRGDTTVEVVHPETFLRVAENEIGEIWVSGLSVAKGYWQRPELTQRTFHAHLVGEPATSFLRTGDLGYIKNGDLYVTGRLKDLIIVYGKKYAPQDIENTAENSHIGLREAGSVAFSVTQNDVERLVIVCELKREWLRRQSDWTEIVSGIRNAVSGMYGVTVGDIVFIKPGALPRTSSGKVRRNQCRLDYLSGELERVAESA